MNKQRTFLVTFGLAIAGMCFFVLPAAAQAPSGAIFTTTVDGSEVNANQYSAKTDVYLDGGPGPGAPQTAAGLDDGVYVFQVTDPSGKTLLSTDAAECRQFTVSGGIIVDVIPSEAAGCAHNTGIDIDHGAITVQLFPYDDTPNPGGVYKAWVTPVGDYACFPDLTQVNCSAGGKHGFIPSHSKTDNFKVKLVPIREIDTWFLDSDGNHLSGPQVTWTDTVGVSNTKWSYFVSFWSVVEAHVEAVEDGTHLIEVDNQPGCTVGDVYLKDEDHDYNRVTVTYLGSGPLTVAIRINNPHKQNHFVLVSCTP